MRRFLIIAGSLAGACVVLAIGAVYLLLSFDIADSVEPFSNSYNLNGGQKVIVNGKSSQGIHGGLGRSYQILLVHADGSREKVGDYSTINEDAPRSPFYLQKTATHTFLASDREIYYRANAGKYWKTWSYQSDENLRRFGRAIMPGRYAHNEKFGDNSYDDHDRLPEVPLYLFERWDLPKRHIVMRQIPHNLRNYYSEKPSALWPPLLSFRNWELDRQKTLALQPKFKLRRIPENIKVEILKMRFSNNMSWEENILEQRQDNSRVYHYENVQKIPGATVLGRDEFSLSKNFHATPLSSWWSNEKKYAPTTLQIRGLCGDPNPKLMHFQWKAGNGKTIWQIAHNTEWLWLRQESGILEAPFIFARFSWKP